MKQAIVVRTDLDMGVGKLAAQVAHASLNAYEEADAETRGEWRSTGQTKVVLQIGSESELLELADTARRDGLPVSVVRDAGRTQLESGTVTTLGIGPADEDVLDRITGELSLY